MSAADLRESVASKILEARTVNGRYIWLAADKRIPTQVASDITSAALRVIADAGPTDAMVEAAARLIARDFALSTSIGGAEAWSAERWPDFSDIARSALSAALKEMG